VCQIINILNLLCLKFLRFFEEIGVHNPNTLIPAKAGCKEGWWPYAGYCYKIIGFTGSIWDDSEFKQYASANSTCNSEWSGGMLAKLPTIEHNQLVASLLGPNFAGNFPWIGIYNYAYYDYYFTHVDQKPLMYTNWESGMPNHLSGNTQRCAQMNWRTKQTYYDVIKLGSFV